MSGNTISLIILTLVLVLCCGPMLFMMVKGGRKRSDTSKPGDTNNKDRQ